MIGGFTIPNDKEDEEDLYIELNQIKGIGPAIKKKLVECKYDSLKLIATSDSKELAGKTGISESKCVKIIKDARDKIGFSFKPADQIYEERKKIGRITTGSTKLDLMLGGGIETQSITEVYGSFKSGKTQLAFQLALNVQLPKDQGGLESGAIFIDTEGTFRPERILEMASDMGLDPMKVLNNIQVAKVFNSEHQILLVKQLKTQLRQNPARVIILDSLMTYFRADYIGSEHMRERQGKILSHLNDLKSLANMYDLAVFVTNHVSASFDPIGDKEKPTGGNVVAHLIQTRVSFKPSRGNQRIARLIDSPYLPEGQIVFQICSEGIRDI